MSSPAYRNHHFEPSSRAYSTWDLPHPGLVSPLRMPFGSRTSALSATGLLATLAGLVSGRAHAQGLDRPIAEVWPPANEWSPTYEHQYEQFVVAIGGAVAAGRCATLSACLNNPALNPLFERGARPMHFRADCADVPYILRAYFSYRHQLPFAYARDMHGYGRDARYFAASRPSGIKLWTDFVTPRELFEQIGSDVHSGYFRTAPEIEDLRLLPRRHQPRRYPPPAPSSMTRTVTSSSSTRSAMTARSCSSTDIRAGACRTLCSLEAQVLGGPRQGGGVQELPADCLAQWRDRPSAQS